MKSIFLLGLASMAVVAYAAKPFSAAYSDDLSAAEIAQLDAELAKYNVTVDWRELEDTADSIEDRWEDYQEYEANYNRVQQADLKKALEDTYKNTVGKLMMEYGTLVGPLFEHAEEVAEGVDFNGTCNDDCAMKCWSAKRFDTYNGQWVYGFNQTCVNKCGCAFKFESYSGKDAREFNKNANLLEKDIKSLQKYGADLAKNASSIMVPALERYNNRSAELMNEYLSTVRATAILDLGCETSCVNHCTNGYLVTFWDLSACLSNCSCDGLDDSIHLDQGHYNMPELVLYAKGSHDALAAFYRNKDKF